MVKRRNRSELAIVFALFLLSVALRFAAADGMEVEHFDEGVYASILWYDAVVGAPYPARQLYAPPLLSTLIELFALVPGCARLAPFLPSLLAGAFTTLILWRLVRSWFGSAAGLFVASIVALSDFHILYSRMALTDVPALMFLCASVGFGVSGIHHRAHRRMVFAGIACGLAWWTKYTGWLPLAILCSGSGLWWLWRGRTELSFARLSSLNATAAVTAFGIWSPWLLQLQDSGGYAAVAANHGGYLTGLSSWRDNLAMQLTCQFRFDGLSGCLSAGLGLFLAGSHRWIRIRRSTGNAWHISPDSATGTFPPPHVLARFTIAAVGVTAITFTVWTPLLLTCIAMGGTAGIFLWPVLQRLHARSQTRDLSPTSVGALPLTQEDLNSAPDVDPSLAVCVVVAWFGGMFVMTPLYHPYSRLLFPLTSVIWIAAAGGVGWWIESNLSVARRPAIDVRPSLFNRLASRLTTIILTVAVLISLLSLENPFSTLILEDRSSQRLAAQEVAEICRRSALGKSVAQQRIVPLNTTFSPDWRESDMAAPDSPDMSDASDAEPDTDPRLVIYAYGEPAVLFHLNSLGSIARPVGHLNLSTPGTGGQSDGTAEVHRPTVSSYLVLGPYAKRTPGFWEEWLSRESGFELVGEVEFRPSEIVLLDLFSPSWLRSHEDARVQRLEIYRIR